MSKLVKNLALGVGAGLVAGLLVHFSEAVEASTDEHKPLIPSSVTALLTKLAPLGAALMAEVLNHGAPDDQDTASATTADEASAPSAQATAAGEHPAGPEFAATPS